MREAVVRLSLLLVMVSVACKGPAGPALTGTFSGFVHLHDEYGAPLGADSGVTVTAAPSATTATTDPNGAYAFSGLSTGVYSLTYDDTDVGTYVMPDVQFLGGGTIAIPLVNLSLRSSGVVTGLAVTPNAAGDTILVTGVINAPPVGTVRYIRLFYGLTDAVGPNVAAYNTTGPYLGTLPYPVLGGPFSIAVTGADLAAIHNTMGAGASGFAVAYGESYYENSYEDAGTGKTIYPNVAAAASNVVPFTVP